MLHRPKFTYNLFRKCGIKSFVLNIETILFTIYSVSVLIMKENTKTLSENAQIKDRVHDLLNDVCKIAS